MIPNDFFKSDKDYLVFTLLHLDGQTRCNYLNITEEMYGDKELADNWYNDIKNKIVSEPNTELERKALIKLKSIYDVMIDYDAFEE